MGPVSQKSNDKITFRCYAPGNGHGGIHDWFDGLEGEVLAAIEAAIEVLSHTRPSRWDDRQFGALHGACLGLSVLRVDIPLEDVNIDGSIHAWRILAFEGPGKNEITLLDGFQETSTADYGYPCHKAQNRKSGVMKDGNRAPRCEFP